MDSVECCDQNCGNRRVEADGYAYNCCNNIGNVSARKDCIRSCKNQFKRKEDKCGDLLFLLICDFTSCMCMDV